MYSKKLYILTPVYNDWKSFNVLIDNIAKIQSQLPGFDIFVVAVNDCSTEQVNINTPAIPCTVLNLKINVGHQRAIAIGLQYIYSEVESADYVVVMDSDGEDRPEDVPALLSKAENEDGRKIIFAKRNKRQDSVFFKMGYFFYKGVFRFLTGQKINFGNFSIIPKALLKQVVHQENIWNHYSGGILSSKVAHDKIVLDRGKRYHGVSKMNFSSLILHGLSSISVYFDVLSLRILRFSLMGILFCTAAVVFILYKKMTGDAIPGWASSLTLIITGIILQLFSVTLIVLLLQLSSRKQIAAPNSKKYKDFIDPSAHHTI